MGVGSTTSAWKDVEFVKFGNTLLDRSTDLYLFVSVVDKHNITKGVVQLTLIGIVHVHSTGHSAFFLWALRDAMACMQQRSVER